MIFLISLLTACSPYVYQKEIFLFNEGVNNSVETFTILNEEFSNDYKENQRERIIKRFDEIKKENSEDSSEELSDKLYNEMRVDIQLCDNLYLNYSKSNPISHNEINKCKLTLAIKIKKYSAIGNALKKYADTLLLITNTDSKKQLAFSQENLTSSIQEFQETLRIASNSSKEPIPIEPFGGFVSLATNSFLEQRRFDVLKKVVNAMHQNIIDAAYLIEKQAQQLYATAIKNKYKYIQNKLIESDNALDSGDSETYSRILFELHDDLEQYKNMFRSTPSELFKKLITSHESLLESINNRKNKKQTQVFFNSVYDFNTSSKTALNALFMLKQSNNNEGHIDE